MIFAFTAASSAELADIPATVIDIWPRLPSGDYLVVLEYGQPVRLENHLVTQIGALVSELYVPCSADARCPSTPRIGFQRRTRGPMRGRSLSGPWQHLSAVITHALHGAAGARCSAGSVPLRAGANRSPDAGLASRGGDSVSAHRWMARRASTPTVLIA
jgi:hypothetical protein